MMSDLVALPYRGKPDTSRPLPLHHPPRKKFTYIDRLSPVDIDSLKVCTSIGGRCLLERVAVSPHIAALAGICVVVEYT